jgi:hypothetical protein
MSVLTPVEVIVQGVSGRVIWEYQILPFRGGITSKAYLDDGTQQRIIDALLSALIEARGQLRSPPT